MPHEIPLWHFNQTLIPKSHLNWEFMKIYYKTKVIWLSILQNHFQSFLIKVQWSQGECQIHDFLLRVIPSIGIWHYCVHTKICIKYRKHGWIVCVYSILTSKSIPMYILRNQNWQFSLFLCSPTFLSGPYNVQNLYFCTRKNEVKELDVM